jgi:CheY-like chemotaxis protein
MGSELLNSRVLVVDDDHDTLEIMRVILDSHGAQTAVAASANEALAAVKIDRPEVILSDIAMPGHDGYDFVREVRALPPDEGGDTPAVAVSAHVNREDRERAFDAGFQAFLAKPLNPGTLVECVKGIVERGRAHLERRHGPRRGPHSPSGVTSERRLFDSERRLFERRQPIC